MANIRNSISMQDRMTPTLRSILKAMDSTLRVMKQLDKASNNGAQSKAYRQAEKDIKRANNALIKMGNYNKLISLSAEKGTRAYTRMGMAVSGVASGMRAVSNSSTHFLQSLASGVYLAQKLGDKIGGMMTTADASRSQVARLGLFNESSSSNEELYGRIFATAMSTRSGLTDTADLANKILMSGVFSGANSVDAAIGTTSIINKALVAGGGSDEENARALRQLTQGLASGVLQGDELRSIREQAPYFAKVLAEGLGQVDDKFKDIGIGDLKELGAQGELTADRVIKAMWAMQDEITEDFDAMPKTFQQAMTSMKNVWQYFLYMISDADGPLGKINDRLWQFVDYLQSPEGLELMNSVAIGINFVSTALSGALGAAGEFVTFLQDNAPVAQAIFIALGVAALAAATKATIAWIAACWPILLVASLVGLVAYSFLEAGYTASEVIGAIVGGIYFVASVLSNAIAFALAIVLGAATAIAMVIAFIISLIDGLCVFFTNITDIMYIAWTNFWTGAVTFAYDCIVNLLDELEILAGAMDTILGTNFAGKIGEWKTGITTVYHSIVDQPLNEVADAERRVATAWDDWNNRSTSRYDSIMGVVSPMLSAIDGLRTDPLDEFSRGQELGAKLVEEIDGLGMGIPGNSVLGQFNEKDVTVDGGYLDGIKSDVNINEEDLQLLRDMTARDFLLQLQTITPVANVTFGDVRETADVGQILDVIEQMVDEQMATALVS